MFNTVIEVSEELHKLNQRRFIPQFYKDYCFKKYKKQCTEKILELLSNKIINYGTMVSLLRFHVEACEVLNHFNKKVPLCMMSGEDIISVMYKYGHLRCEMRYNVENIVYITKVYTVPDENNVFIEKHHKSYDTMHATELSKQDKVRLISQIINYINVYMTLVYEYGVEE